MPASLFAALIGPRVALAQSMRTVPLDHWAYEIADHLLLRYPELGSGIWIGNRPGVIDFGLAARADSVGLGDIDVTRRCSGLLAEPSDGASRGDDVFSTTRCRAVLGSPEDARRSSAVSGRPVDEPAATPSPLCAPSYRRFRGPPRPVARPVASERLRTSPRSHAFRLSGGETRLRLRLLDAYAATARSLWIRRSQRA